MLLYSLADNSDIGLLKSYILGILLVLAIFYLIILFLKTYKKGILFKRGGHLRVIETLPLSKDNILYIIKVNDKYFLIGSSAGNIIILKELEHDEFEDLQTSDATRSISFKDNFNKILGRSRDRGEK